MCFSSLSVLRSVAGSSTAGSPLARHRTASAIAVAFSLQSICSVVRKSTFCFCRVCIDACVLHLRCLSTPLTTHFHVHLKDSYVRY